MPISVHLLSAKNCAGVGRGAHHVDEAADEGHQHDLDQRAEEAHDEQHGEGPPDGADIMPVERRQLVRRLARRRRGKRVDARLKPAEHRALSCILRNVASPRRRTRRKRLHVSVGSEYALARHLAKTMTPRAPKLDWRYCMDGRSGSTRDLESRAPRPGSSLCVTISAPPSRSWRATCRRMRPLGDRGRREIRAHAVGAHRPYRGARRRRRHEHDRRPRVREGRRSHLDRASASSRPSSASRSRAPRRTRASGPPASRSSRIRRTRTCRPCT